MEPNVIIEITTSSVPRKRSPTELIGQDVHGAPDRNRTRSSLVKSQEPFQLGDRGMVPVEGIEPSCDDPKSSVLPLNETGMVGAERIELS